MPHLRELVRMKGKGIFRPLSIVTQLVVLVAISSCAASPAATSPTASRSPDLEAVTSSSYGYDPGQATTGQNLSTLFATPEQYAEDRAAWAVLATEGAVEAEFFGTLDEIAEESTAVIIGTVVELGPTRTIVGDAEGDVLELPSLRVRVDRLIRGSLPTGDGPGDFLTLETLRVPPADRLPRHPALMFLRYKHDPASPATPVPSDEGKYRLVSSQGLMIPGPDGTTLLPVFEAAYRDLLGDPSWTPSNPTSLYGNVRDSSVDQIVAVIESRS